MIGPQFYHLLFSEKLLEGWDKAETPNGVPYFMK
jgi:hypothetical protein